MAARPMIDNGLGLDRLKIRTKHGRSKAKIPKFQGKLYPRKEKEGKEEKEGERRRKGSEVIKMKRQVYLPSTGSNFMFTCATLW